MLCIGCLYILHVLDLRITRGCRPPFPPHTYCLPYGNASALQTHIGPKARTLVLGGVRCVSLGISVIGCSRLFAVSNSQE